MFFQSKLMEKIRTMTLLVALNATSKHLNISDLNKIIFTISNKNTKTGEILVVKYIKITKLYVMESHVFVM